MARYDVYPNPDGAGYLLDVQADLLDTLNTRVVVPLMPVKQAPKPAKGLNPIFVFHGDEYVMVTQLLAAVLRSLLKIPIANLSDDFADITNALDMTFQGF